MYLARKITRAKWPPKIGLIEGEIPADAVTADLRTTENTLSFWRCGQGTAAEIEEAVLAIAAGGDRLDKLDVIWISEEELRADNQTCKDTDGRTPVASLVKQHVDIYKLDYVRLGRIADRVVAAITSGRFQRLNKKRVTKLVAEAVKAGHVALEKLEVDVQADVRKLVEGENG